MAKQVLGRNLGALLDDGVKEAGKGDSCAPQTTPAGSGVRSLMRGHQGIVAKPAEAAPQRRSMVPGWYLFGGDIVLAALALVIVGKSPHPLTWQRELFCAGAVILGGCLALGAILLQEDHDDR